jgi:NADPH:quinone reductase-like Zn-dependent oxidoreductase
LYGVLDRIPVVGAKICVMSHEQYDAMVMDGPGATLQRVARAMPSPGPGEAVVRVRASSLNYHDLVNLMGLLPGPWPRVPMSDGAGEVVAVGTEVRNVSVGDRVISTFHPGWLDGGPTPEAKRVMPGDSCDGWLEQFHVFPAAALVATPAHLTDAQAATIPCAGTTAWSALEKGHIGAGDVVVTQGTGGVSLYALQLAKARGATVILTSSADAKLDFGAGLGADHGINYTTTPDWEREVRTITRGRGADLVVDIGGEHTLAHSVRATRMDGTVAIVGVLSGFGAAQIPVSDAMMQNIHLVGITVGSVQAHADLAAAMTAGSIVPPVSHVLGWDAVPEAMRVMQANEHIGKIAIEIP